jgi:hypothetical protein
MRSAAGRRRLAALARAARHLERLLCDNDILALDKPTGVRSRPDVPEGDVARHSAKERNSGADEHRNAGDDEALNEPRLKKALNGYPAIHVNV